MAWSSPASIGLVASCRSCFDDYRDPPPTSFVRNPKRAAILLAVLTLATLATLAHYRPISRVWGDEGTYLAMMASLAEDGDLRFEAPDLARIQSAEGGRAHLILERCNDKVAYSKPIFFAMIASPFYKLFGEWGPILLNALGLAFALTLAFTYLRRWGDDGKAALVTVTFAAGGVMIPYVTWRMTDSFQAALAVVGLILCFGRYRGELPTAPRALDRLIVWRGSPILGAALLGITVNMRVSNGVLVAAVVGAALLAGRPWRALLLGSTAIVTFLALAGGTLALTGASNPYRTARTTFTPATGYPAGAEADAALARFEVREASDKTGLDTYTGAERIAYATLYFFVGRHTGMIFYFPTAFVFLLFALRRSDPAGRAALLAFGGALLFFVAWRADNYFGGDTFIGNRYLPSIYPLLLVALPRLPGPRWLAVAWAIATVSYGSALISVTRHHEIDTTSQSHTRAGLFRLLPYETTALDIAGRRDRYWAGHFVRFVDRFPGVGPWHAELYAGRPGAELLVAHWRPLEKIRLFVQTSAPEATLELRDYARRATFPVGTLASEAIRGPLGVQVDLEPSRPWRRHRYWWDTETPYYSRSLRLRLLVPAGPATAVIRYFGDPQLHRRAFSYERLEDTAPNVAPASSTSQISFKLRNTSPLTWEAEDVVPVRARYRLTLASGEVVTESPRFELPQSVPPFHEVEVAFDVDWPQEPGSYLLEADLVLEHVAWFAEHLGDPVIRRQVEVTSAE